MAETSSKNKKCIRATLGDRLLLRYSCEFQNGTSTSNASCHSNEPSTAKNESAWNRKRFAIRSSAVGEDSGELSSAGQNETILGTIKFMSDVGILMGLTDGSDRQLVRSLGDRIESTGVSFMPVGLESGLSLIQMADLLAWVQKAD